MRVAVIGAGYVGLVTGAGLAALGHEVRVGERNPKSLALLGAGKVPFFEPDLEALVADGLDSGALSFYSSNLEAVRDAEIVFIAVPTPQDADGSADMSIVESVIKEVAPSLSSTGLVVLKSTVPMGSADRLRDLMARAGGAAELVNNPEFLREGRAVADFFNPDRIVIGSTTQTAVEQMIELYRKLDAPIVVTDSVSAELIKYASNAFLATRVTFANAVANLCESVGADVRDVLLGMGYDSRIGFHFFNPGPGFGGSCFPKDTRALVAVAEEYGYDFALLKGVIEVNELQLERILEKAERAAGGTLAGKRIGLWGLAFKAGTDDVRESPALRIATRLHQAGAKVTAHDPKVTIDSAEFTGAATPLDAAREADVLIIATEWPEYRSQDFREIREVMTVPSILDARNLLDPAAIRRLGFSYDGVGR